MARLVLSFASIHDALAAEKAVLTAPEGPVAGGQCCIPGLESAKAELLPLPPSIKSDCGFGLFLDTIEGEEPLALASLRASIRFEAAYSLRGVEGARSRGKETIYERIDQAH